MKYLLIIISLINAPACVGGVDWGDEKAYEACEHCPGCCSYGDDPYGVTFCMDRGVDRQICEVWAVKSEKCVNASKEDTYTKALLSCFSLDN